uniref:Uncharacterized protein n=1 Tax=Mycena chlorophos TaxID=658473 RepID=A0ABQ0LVH9_MYCCL|nr:predicted protein [Mycena chlorophos]
MNTSGPCIDDALLGDTLESVEGSIPRTLDICNATAFRLAVLLQLRTYKLRRKTSVDDVWTRYTDSTSRLHDIQQIEGQIRVVFDEFIAEHRTTQEIERVLWSPFSISAHSSKQLRVADFLTSTDCPPQLACHGVVMLSLDRLWRRGPCEGGPLRPANEHSRLDQFCTPRVLHCLDLITHLLYFGVLVSYVMHPPYETAGENEEDTEIQRTGWREILLVILSASILCRPWNIFKIPTLVLFIVFLLHLPTVPFAGGWGFDVLLVCFAMHAFQFHFPAAPSPLFFFKRSLPFAAFLVDGFYRVILPFLLFFLPIFVLITTWLSIALSETFFSPLSLIPTPIQTRTTVLYLFFALASVISCSLFVLVVQGRALQDTGGWDGYSPSVGRSARASFAKAVMVYSTAFTFPAPFSLVNVLLLHVPALFWTMILRRPLVAISEAQKLLWRLTVRPFALPIAGLFLLFPDRRLG